MAGSPSPPSVADRLEEAREAMWANDILRADQILRQIIREERQDGLSGRGA